jgi:hypothetical protein
LEYGARFDIENDDKKTAMQLACEKKEFEHAIAKYQIPPRTKEEEAIVKGTSAVL